jgi:hypothetical protein
VYEMCSSVCFESSSTSFYIGHGQAVPGGLFPGAPCTASLRINAAPPAKVGPRRQRAGRGRALGVRSPRVGPPAYSFTWLDARWV